MSTKSAQGDFSLSIGSGSMTTADYQVTIGNTSFGNTTDGMYQVTTWPYHTTTWPYILPQDNIYHYHYYYNWPPAQPALPVECENKNTMKTTTKQLDDKILLIAELAGFKKEEVKVKYFAPESNATESGYILITAESKTHVLKEASQESYKLEYKKSITYLKKLDFSTAQIIFDNGILTISIEYDETNKIKQLEIQ